MSTATTQRAYYHVDLAIPGSNYVNIDLEDLALELSKDTDVCCQNMRQFVELAFNDDGCKTPMQKFKDLADTFLESKVTLEKALQLGGRDAYESSGAGAKHSKTFHEALAIVRLASLKAHEASLEPTTIKGDFDWNERMEDRAKDAGEKWDSIVEGATGIGISERMSRALNVEALDNFKRYKSDGRGSSTRPDVGDEWIWTEDKVTEYHMRWEEKFTDAEFAAGEQSASTGSWMPKLNDHQWKESILKAVKTGISERWIST